MSGELQSKDIRPSDEVVDMVPFKLIRRNLANPFSDQQIVDLIEADGFRQGVISKADGKTENGSPWWYGWVIVDAYLAGVKAERERNKA